MSRPIKFDSVALSQFLRHTGTKQGYLCTKAGAFKIEDVTKFFGTSVNELRKILSKDKKGRFRFLDKDETIIELDDTKSIPAYIMACQGHSSSLKIEEPLLTQVTIPYETCAHSTNSEGWKGIISSGGMKKMSRAHIHFAKGDIDNKEVKSGMRKNMEYKIFLDMKKAMEDGIIFYESANGVLLTTGNSNNLLPCKYFKQVYFYDNLVPAEKYLQ